MEKKTPAIFLTMNEFEKLLKSRLMTENFFASVDKKTVYTNHYFDGGQIFIKPEGRDSWI